MKTASRTSVIRRAASADLVGQRSRALAAIEPDDQGRAAEHDEQQEPLRPRLLEPELRRDRLAGPGRLDAQSIGQSAEQPVHSSE